jgi:hypothetical protein
MRGRIVVVVSQAADASSERLIAGQDHSPFAGRNDLSRVKTEADDVAMSADLPTSIARSQGTGGVLDDRHIPPAADGKKSIEISR